jgi:Uma2 family endonuclease
MSAVAEPTTPVAVPPHKNGAMPRPSIDPYADGDDTLFEVVRGVRVEKHMGVLQNMIAAALYSYLAPFCREHQIGHAAIETMFAIPGSGNDRKPDVAFVSFDRWAKNRPIPQSNAWPVVPDLAVEVISPTDKAFDVMAKVREYFAGGVREVWQVYSNTEQVLVFSSPTTVRILTRADELTGDPVVPGFRVKVADLFPVAEATV